MPTATKTPSTASVTPANPISSSANSSALAALLNQLTGQGVSGNLSGIGGLPAGTVSYPNTLPGAAPQAGQGAYGAVPTAANPQATQAAAVAGNDALASQIGDLTKQLDLASASGALGQLSQNLPGYTGLMTSAVGDVGSELAGQLSPGTMALLQQQAAESGVNSGMSGSPASNAAAMRAMGLTAEQLQQQGQTDLGNLIKTVPTGIQFDPSTMLVTPEQQLAQQNYANQLSAAPDPAMAAAAEEEALKAGMASGNRAGGAAGNSGLGTAAPGGAVAGGVPSYTAGGGGAPFSATGTKAPGGAINVGPQGVLGTAAPGGYTGTTNLSPVPGVENWENLNPSEQAALSEAYYGAPENQTFANYMGSVGFGLPETTMPEDFVTSPEWNPNQTSTLPIGYGGYTDPYVDWSNSTAAPDTGYIDWSSVNAPADTSSMDWSTVAPPSNSTWLDETPVFDDSGYYYGGD